MHEEPAQPEGADAVTRRQAAAVAGHCGEANLALAYLDDDEPAVRAGALRALERAGGLDVRRQAATLALRGAAFEELCDRSRDAVVAAGARIRRLETRRRTLEDLFEDAAR